MIANFVDATIKLPLFESNRDTAEGPDDKVIKVACCIFFTFSVLVCAYYSHSRTRRLKEAEALKENNEREAIGLERYYEVTRLLKLPRSSDASEKKLTNTLHRLAYRMYSERNLKANIHVFTETASDVIQKFLSDGNMLEVLEPMLKEYSDRAQKSLMIINFDGTGLTPGQIEAFTTDLSRTTLSAIPPIINRAIVEFSDRPELQDTVYQKLSPEAGVFCDEILRMILEAIRTGLPVGETRREGKTISLGPMALSNVIFGPNAEAFNPNRFGNLPRSWAKALFPLFGGGPNVCSAPHFVKYTTAQFLTILLRRYRIEKRKSTAAYFEVHFVPRKKAV